MWKEFHQYHTKGKVQTINFKLKDINATTVWLHCSSGKPNEALIKNVSDNAQCRLVRGARGSGDIGVHCQYKKGEQKLPTNFPHGTA